jgi:hypothetical protein
MLFYSKMDRAAPRSVIYECEICGGFHSWNLDCSNDANRYASKDDYAHRNGVRISDIDTRSMHQRTATDPERRLSVR